MNRFRKIASLVLPLLAVGFCLAVPAVGQAALIQVTGSGTVQGQSVSAEADFTVLANGNLQITLTNTAAATPDVSQVLSNIEFNLNGGAVVFDPTKSSVTLASASNLVDNGSIVDYSLNPDGSLKLATTSSTTTRDISRGYGYATTPSKVAYLSPFAPA